MHRRWKQRKAAQKKYRGISQAGSNGVTKDKGLLEMNVERYFKSLNNSFYNYMTRKIKLQRE